MVSSSVYEYIAGIIPEQNILLKEPMSLHTTFRVGGEAKALLQVEQEEQIIKLIQFFKRLEEPYFILGNGSNLLVGDRGYDGFVIQVGSKMSQVEVKGTTMKVQAGSLLSQAAKAAMEHGLTGLEFASGIPGTIGGAVVMNAGAYDGEMQQVVKMVKVLNKDGEVMELDNATMEFAYRNSVIRNKAFIVLEVVLELTAGDKNLIQSKMTELSERRRDKQPLEYPSAGSTFKRPQGNFAGKLIMEAGLKGFQIGGAQVSEKHCGFIINAGNATAADIVEVINTVCEKVYESSNVLLETEVIRIGDF